MFWQRYDKDGTITELSLMPPCQKNLAFHCKRANYIAYMYKHADELILEMESPEKHGLRDNNSENEKRRRYRRRI